LGIKVTPQHLNRLLKQMGLSTRSKPILETESDRPSRSNQSIQIENLDTASMSDTSDWNFNPLSNN
jgi:hypothetical protein